MTHRERMEAVFRGERPDAMAWFGDLTYWYSAHREIADLRTLAGDDVILIGGLPGTMFAPPFTAKDIEKQVKEIIKYHKDSNKFVFGVADQVPPNGNLNLVKLVSELIEEYGRY